MLRKYLKRAGIGNASIHTLRHTYGVQQIQKGESFKAVKETLGLREHRTARSYISLATGNA